MVGRALSVKLSLAFVSAWVVGVFSEGEGGDMTG